MYLIQNMALYYTEVLQNFENNGVVIAGDFGDTNVQKLSFDFLTFYDCTCFCAIFFINFEKA